MNRRVGRAMHAYGMLANGDRILAAVSGGVDSLVLAWLLHFWQQKAPITYDILALHVDMEPDNGQPGESARKVQKQLELFGIEAAVVPAAWKPSGPAAGAENDTRNICYACSSSRRKQIFDFARQENCNKIALGHHQDDIIETFFLNLCFAGNISTMVPRQVLFDGRLSLIRPLAFLAKEDIILTAQRLGFTPVRSPCPLSEKTKRMDVRNMLTVLYRTAPEAKQHIFAALSNVRHEYLLQRNGKEGPGKGGADADEC